MGAARADVSHRGRARDGLELLDSFRMASRRTSGPVRDPRSERATRRLSSDRVTIRRPTTWAPEPLMAEDGGDDVRPDAIPRPARPARDLLRLRLDARAGFVLSMVDGHTTVQTIIDVCGLPDAEVVALLRTLRDAGAITLGPPAA